jgi:hypothetical protein
LQCETTEGGTSCGGAWFAPCRPVGTSPGLEFLPPHALRFDSKFGKASLKADFECTRTDGAGSFILDVDLKWKTDTVLFDVHEVVESPGPPPTVTEIDTTFSFPVVVKGSAFDGTTEHVNAETEGALVHREVSTTVLQ